MIKTKGIRSKIPQVWLNRLILAVKVVIASGLILFLFTSGRLNFALIIDSYKYPIYLFSGALYSGDGYSDISLVDSGTCPKVALGSF